MSGKSKKKAKINLSYWTVKCFNVNCQKMVPVSNKLHKDLIEPHFRNIEVSHFYIKKYDFPQITQMMWANNCGFWSKFISLRHRARQKDSSPRPIKSVFETILNTVTWFDNTGLTIRLKIRKKILKLSHQCALID